MGNNVDKIWSKIIIPALGQTAYMTVLSIVISVSIAFVLAIVLVYTGNDGLKPNKIVYGILDVIINILRSVPFIILAVSIIPLTRFILKTSIGETAAVIPLSVASAPFVARLFKNSFKKVDPSIIEAAKSFGASDMQIMFGVIIKEAVPSLVMDITLASITILGLTAMAGAVGAGGLGAVGLTYGYQSFNDTIMFTTVILLIVITAIIQVLGQIIYKIIK